MAVTNMGMEISILGMDPKENPPGYPGTWGAGDLESVQQGQSADAGMPTLQISQSIADGRGPTTRCADAAG